MRLGKRCCGEENWALTFSPTGNYSKPLTVEDVRRKLDNERLTKTEETRLKIRNHPQSKSQNWDDDDSELNSDYKPLLLHCARAAKKKAEEAGQDPSGAAMMGMRDENRKQGNANRRKQLTKKANAGETALKEKASSAQT